MFKGFAELTMHQHSTSTVPRARQDHQNLPSHVELSPRRAGLDPASKSAGKKVPRFRETLCTQSIEISPVASTVLLGITLIRQNSQARALVPGLEIKI